MIYKNLARTSEQMDYCFMKSETSTLQNNMGWSSSCLHSSWGWGKQLHGGLSSAGDGSGRWVLSPCLVSAGACHQAGSRHRKGKSAHHCRCPWLSLTPCPATLLSPSWSGAGAIGTMVVAAGSRGIRREDGRGDAAEHGGKALRVGKWDPYLIWGFKISPWGLLLQWGLPTSVGGIGGLGVGVQLSLQCWALLPHPPL